MKSMRQVKKLVDIPVKQEYKSCKKIFIPIHHGNHFSLLEFEKEERRWIHYDSNKPRRDGGEHQKIADKMVCV